LYVGCVGAAERVWKPVCWMLERSSLWPASAHRWLCPAWPRCG